MKEKILIKKLDNYKGNDKLPISLATEGSVGWDLKAMEDQTIYPNFAAMFNLGIALVLPENYYATICSRSGLAAKECLFVLNSPGIVDTDYTGELGVILYNGGSEPRYVKKGQRIAQLLINVKPEFEFQLTDDLPVTGRGNKGFGSTGK